MLENKVLISIGGIGGFGGFATRSGAETPFARAWAKVEYVVFR